MGRGGVAAGLGLALVLLGILAAMRLLTAVGPLLLILALGLVVASLTGMAGRWALGLAAILALFALPYVAVGTLRFAWTVVGMVFRMVPLALVVLGIYLVVRAGRR